MPATLTLTVKNIPEDVYRRLKLSAEAHRRSLNSEAIMCLEAVLTPNRLPQAKGKGWRARVPCGANWRRQVSSTSDIDTAKRQGRP